VLLCLRYVKLTWQILTNTEPFLPSFHKQNAFFSCPSNQVGSQEHVSLISNGLFFFMILDLSSLNTTTDYYINPWLHLYTAFIAARAFSHVCTFQGNLLLSNLILE